MSATGKAALPSTYVPGKFSVAPGKQVYFAKGNLYCFFPG